MSDLDPLRNLAQALAMDPGQPVTMTKGLVQNYDIAGQPPTLNIYLSGDTSTLIEGVRFIDSYSPSIGDVVQVIKQGPMLLVLGQIAGGANHAANGWVEPTLSANWATFSFDPVMYRLILDNGSKKIQLRGRASITGGSPTTIWTMPAALRPLFNMAPILVPRGFSGGSAVAQIDVYGGADGTIRLNAATVGVTGVSSSGGSTTGSTDTNHKHRSSDFPSGNANPANLVYTAHWTDLITQGPITHTHTTPNHTHTMTSVTYPDFISFNGVEYFI